MGTMPCLATLTQPRTVTRPLSDCNQPWLAAAAAACRLQQTSNARMASHRCKALALLYHHTPCSVMMMPSLLLWGVHKLGSAPAQHNREQTARWTVLVLYIGWLLCAYNSRHTAPGDAYTTTQGPNINLCFSVAVWCECTPCLLATLLSTACCQCMRNLGIWPALHAESFSYHLCMAATTEGHTPVVQLWLVVCHCFSKCVTMGLVSSGSGVLVALN